MPLVSQLGEQSLNATTGEDQPGRGVWLVNDSDGNLFGLVEEYRGAEFRVSAFFVRGDSGVVTPRYELGADTVFNIAQYDQDAFLIYPASGGGAESYPPIILYSESAPYVFEGDVSEYPPNYVFDGGALFRADVEPAVPTGQARLATFANGTARVYQAPDGDGMGIFLDVRDSEGNRIGGVVRVNDDIAGDQYAPIVAGLDEAFTVAWTQEAYDGANAELYRAKTFDLSPNISLAIVRDEVTGAFAGDVGDFVTDLLFFNTSSAELISSERIVNFGANDILATTSKIFDSNDDGIITFGRDKRLDLTNADGERVTSVAFTGGVKSLEFDGEIEGSDGQTYYVYSRVGSAADEHYLIV